MNMTLPLPLQVVYFTSPLSLNLQHFIFPHFQLVISLYTSLKEQKPSGNNYYIFSPPNTCTPSFHDEEAYPVLSRALDCMPA